MTDHIGRALPQLTGDDAPCAHLCYCERAGLIAEVARMREAKRMAGLIADERSRENVELRNASLIIEGDLRDIITRARNALVRDGNVMAAAEILMGADEQCGAANGE